MSSKIVCPSNHVDIAKASNTLLTVTQGLLISFASLSLSAFQCFEHPNTKQTMYQFPQIVCFDSDGDHKVFVCLSLWMLASVIIPFNVVYIFAVCVAYVRRRDFDASIALLVRFKLFFQRWRAERWYWGYIFVLRQMVFACMLFIGNDAVEQITFAISVLTIYNIGLAVLFPWRMFEINVVEFALTVLLVFVLLNSFAVVPQATDVLKFRNAVSTFLWIILCFSVCYIGRVCWGGVVVGGGPNRIFVGWPKRLDHRKVAKSLDAIFMTSLDATTTENLVSQSTDDDLRVMEIFFNLLQKSSCASFDFDFDVGTRMYVPSRNHIDKQNRSDMAVAIKGKTKTNESYI